LRKRLRGAGRDERVVVAGEQQHGHIERRHLQPVDQLEAQRLEDARLDHADGEAGDMMGRLFLQPRVIVRDPLRREQEDRLGIHIFPRAIGAKQRQPGVEAARGIAIEPAPAIDHHQPVDALRRVERHAQATHAADRVAEDRGLPDAERVHKQADIVADALDARRHRPVRAAGAAMIVEDDTVMLGERGQIGPPIFARSAHAGGKDQRRRVRRAMFLIVEARRVHQPICATEAISTRQSGFTRSARMQ